VSALFDRLANLDTAGLEAQSDAYGGIPYLRFDATAQAIFDDWRANLERRIRSGDYPPAFEAHLAKYRSLVPSLALLCHLIEGDVSGAVGEESLLRALAWSEYLESHARRVYAYATDTDLASAKELHRRIVQGSVKSPFTARDVYRKHWSLLDKEQTSRAIEYLEDSGHIRKKTDAPKSSGRPSVDWEVYPLLEQKKNSDAPDRG